MQRNLTSVISVALYQLSEAFCPLSNGHVHAGPIEGLLAKVSRTFLAERLCGGIWWGPSSVVFVDLSLHTHEPALGQQTPQDDTHTEYTDRVRLA